jgi:hypothetical protein
VPTPRILGILSLVATAGLLVLFVLVRLKVFTFRDDFTGCGIGSWEGPASENGRLRHRDGGHEEGDRCRRSFVLPIL